MALYTIIADYAGGTYTAQHRATSPRAALTKWVRDSDSAKYVHGRNQAAQEALQRDLTDPDTIPVPLTGLVRVWCASALVRGKLLLLNIVETSGAPNPQGGASGKRPSRSVANSTPVADDSRR
jgi:hypothetical protein